MISEVHDNNIYGSALLLISEQKGRILFFKCNDWSWEKKICIGKPSALALALAWGESFW